jgi:hypothetical protein
MCSCYPEEEKPMVSGSDRRASLSPHYAFVVQLATDTEIDTGRLHGRVEHVVSRQATHFASLEALLAFMARVLRDIAASERAAAAEVPPAPHGSSAPSDTDDAR